MTKYYPKRHKTNSVTELVKIIATEVFEGEKEKLKEEIKKEVKLKNWDKSNANELWGTFETNNLSEDIESFIRCMAVKHKRSYGAIVSKFKCLNTYQQEEK